MSDMPWFPMWAADFLNARSVRLMTPEQVGVYILLLCHEWNDGPLPGDPENLRALANNADVNTVRTVLDKCFVSTDDGWLNERLEGVRLEQEAKREQKVRAGQASGKARRRNKIERRSNVRSNRTRTEREQNANESESESESEELLTTAVDKSTEAGASPNGPRPADEPPPIDSIANTGERQAAYLAHFMPIIRQVGLSDDATNGSIIKALAKRRAPPRAMEEAIRGLPLVASDMNEGELRWIYAAKKDEIAEPAWNKAKRAYIESQKGEVSSLVREMVG